MKNSTPVELRFDLETIEDRAQECIILQNELIQTFILHIYHKAKFNLLIQEICLI